MALLRQRSFRLFGKRSWISRLPLYGKTPHRHPELSPSLQGCESRKNNMDARTSATGFRTKHGHAPGSSDQSPARDWRNRLSAISDGRLFLLIAAPLLTLFLATTMWQPPNNIDAFTNRVAAWSIGTQGTFILDDHAHLTDPDYLGNIAWIVATEKGAASQYPPGAALLAAPLYAVWPDDASLDSLSGSNRPDVAPVELLIPPMGPAAITASLAVAVAIGLLGVAFRQLTETPGPALVGAYVAGLGTSAWSVAANRLWQHGPAMLWIALALVLAQRRMVGSGFAWGAAILTRPPLAVVAAATGLYRSWKERSLKPALLTSIGALVGLGLFIAYNQYIFGSWSISAGYGTSFENRALDSDLMAYAKNVFLGAFSATRGLFVWSPFLLVLIPGLRAGWKSAPSWVRGSALGGLLYLLLQYKANRFSGGGGFYSYRYPLEALTAAAPLLFLAFREWVALRPRAMRLFVALVLTSVLIHSVGAVL